MQTMSNPPGTKLPWWPYLIAMLLLAAGLIPLLLYNEDDGQMQSRTDIMGDTPIVLWTHNIADFGISLASLLIVASLVHFAFTYDGGLPFRGLVLSFTALLLFCSLLHGVMVATTHNPAYALTAGLKWVAAMACIATAISLPLALPKLKDLINTARESENTQIALVQLTSELEQRVDQAVSEQRKVTRQLLLAQQEERKRLSIDIHDGLTQTAAAAHQQLQVLSRKHRRISAQRVSEGVKPKEIHQDFCDDLDQVLGLSQRVVTESRALIEDLRPAVLDDFGLEAALRQRIDQLKDEGWHIAYHVRPTPNGYPDRAGREAEAALYRVFQESLSNITKHSKASRVDVNLALEGRAAEPASAKLTITDNGIGFDPSLVRPQSQGPGKQIGLQSRKELIEQLGGKFDISSAPGRGTTIRAEIPIQDEET